MGKDITYEEAEALVEQIGEAQGEIDDMNNHNASEFSESVGETADSIWDNIQNKGTATPGQLRALRNILEGLKKWIR